MWNFCNVACFTLYLLICKFVTFVMRLKKASAVIWVYKGSQRKCERAK